MRIERRSGKDERRIITAMIVDPVVLGRISEKWNNEMFQSKWSNLIGSWCVKHYRKFGKAPGQNIQSEFERWQAKTKDEKTAGIVESLLQSLSDDYDKLAGESNSDYVLDLASHHFNEVALRHLKEQLEAHLDSGDWQEAEKLLDKRRRVEIGTKAPVDILRDLSAIKAAFTEKAESLIDWPDPMSDFFGDAFCRDALIAFEGPEKRGKTNMLLDLAWRGMLSKRKVAFFEVGDMTEPQIMRRFMTRAAKHPIRARTVKFPTGWEEDGTVAFEERKFTQGLSWKIAKKACDNVLKRSVRNDETLIRLFCCPAGHISINGIEAELERWDIEGWSADIVVIDYADILAPVPGVTDIREKVNATWMKMRALSQVRHCLVATATQAKATAYKADTMGMEHFSEDKRKRAHASGFLGLSQTPDEKTQGILRLNWLALREDDYSVSRCLTVAQCLALCQPMVRGRLD